MTHMLVSPRGVTLPYSSIFNVGLRDKSTRATKSRSPEYFWKKAISGPSSGAAPEGGPVEESNDAWFDANAPAFSDSENEFTPNDNKAHIQRRKKRFHMIRRILFRGFTRKSDGTQQQSSTVLSTEVIGRHYPTNKKVQNSMTSFSSWKFKSKGTKTQVQKVVATLKPRKTRVSASSPADQLPQTWEEYNQWYANQQIDILHPPLPPIRPEVEGGIPSAYQSRFYMAPDPSNEKARQLVLNRLGVFGDKGFDKTEEGTARAKERTEMGDKLMEEGKLPASLDEDWERRASVLSGGAVISGEEVGGEPNGMSNEQLPPETLEQHPIFRNVVKRCRELFNTDFCMLSVLDEDRQIFLAESGGGGQRDTPRDIGFCVHTILSGRKGFAILDTHKDWRFENSPLTQHWNSRFYAGVPLLSPNLDGSQESEDNLFPIGTLCIVDPKPRDSFSVEDRKKFVYMSEYARREIEKWFAKKMERKIEALTAGQKKWDHELKRVISSSSDGDDTLESEVLSDNPASKPSGLWRLTSIKSTSTTFTVPSSHRTSLSMSRNKTGPGLFEDFEAVVKPKMRKIFDAATKLIAELLDLSLVCLTAVLPFRESNELGKTLLISGHNVPQPVPVFDAGLHLRVLRAPEGGYLYQNPSVEECEEASLQPQGPEVQPYASAILIAVGTEARPNSGGFVLAGYTQNPKKVFGAEDVSFMKQFAQQLSKYTSKLQL